MNILVVDDDPRMVAFLKKALTREGYSVFTVRNGAEAVAEGRRRQPDLVILDILIPGVDGIDISRQLRQAGDMPILVLTAREAVADRVAALNSGADDYLVKPFAFDELLARIRALLRRSQPSERELLHFSDLSLNTATRVVKRGDKAVELTVQEFNLLELLMRYPRRVLKRGLIYEKVWGHDFGGGYHVIDVYVSYLRSKLEAGHLPRLIHTVRGVGYVLKE
jgi:two-component system, OmpR family, response regulator MprA